MENRRFAQIVHVLFLDLVGYSRESTSAQARLLDRLNHAVTASPAYKAAQAAQEAQPIPTGDGMALLFTRDVIAPVQCAVEVSHTLRDTADMDGSLKVRMGIHSGLVQQQLDIAGRENVVGEGINTAQRVMDFGEAGHILLSAQYARWLQQFDDWSPHIHQIGEGADKHHQKVQIYSLHAADHGNPAIPVKLAASTVTETTGAEEVKLEPDGGAVPTIERRQVLSYPDLTLRLFGGFEATHADRPLQGLNLREGERLLAYLTLYAGQPIPYHTLAEQFWPGEARLVLDGGGDLASTRQAVHALRTALGPNEVRLTSPRKGTLLLDLTGADVDLFVFDRLAAATDPGSWQAAAALYRGPLLRDWPEAWARNARKQRDWEVHRLLQRLLDAGVRAGDVADQEIWLRRLMAYAPADEATARQLMRLLEETKRRQEAREVGAALRQALTEAGQSPTNETLALEAQLAVDSVRVAQQPEAEPEEEVRLEPVGGAVALESSFYIVRPTDSPFHKALEQRDSIVLIHGARQMGKTSLLARGLNRVRRSGARVLLTDFQSLSEARFASPDSLYLNLAANLAAQQEIDFSPRDEWSEDMDANLNFERFLRKRILAAAETPVVWGMDEVDRLFAYPYASEVFGLLRSWHNRRALDPEGPWSRLTLAIAYSTEAHLFIKDSNQSPFNVGTRILLSDFSADEVAELNRRYGSPLQTEAEVERFNVLMGGHPYLSRAGLNALARKEYTLPELTAAGDGDGGPFQDHLRRLLACLKANPDLSNALRALLTSETPPTPDLFYRLRSAGVLNGGSPNACRVRCQLYTDYFACHL